MTTGQSRSSDEHTASFAANLIVHVGLLTLGQLKRILIYIRQDNIHVNSKLILIPATNDIGEGMLCYHVNDGVGTASRLAHLLPSPL